MSQLIQGYVKLYIRPWPTWMRTGDKDDVAALDQGQARRFYMKAIYLPMKIHHYPFLNETAD